MPDLDPELTLDANTVFYILLKAREFDAKEDEGVDPDEGSNASDDNAIDVLQSQADDSVEEELVEAIEPLNEDEKLDLIALAWIGRGDFDFDEWAEARTSAREVDPAQTAQYLLQMPTLSDYLEDALAQLGFTLEDYLAVEQQAPTVAASGAQAD